MSDKPIEAERLAEARRGAFAALAILSDPNCLPRQAGAHLVDGWRALRGDAEGSLAQWAKDHLSSLDPKRARPTLEFLEAHEADEAAAAHSETQMRALATTLLAEVRAHERGEVGKERRGTLASWGRRFGAWAGVVVVFIVVALRPWTYQGVGQWHGAYYPGKDFRGEPDTRREADVDFTWGALPPTESIPSDRFAARWTTCLRLDADAEPWFQLIADDAARLIIDGEDVIDLWEPRAPVQKADDADAAEKTDSPERPGKEGPVEMPISHGRRFALAAGLHSVVVEYREESDTAEVHLLATFDEDIPPGPLPSSKLEYPGEDFDEDDPCGSL